VLLREVMLVDKFAGICEEIVMPADDKTFKTMTGMRSAPEV
jgi:hypothetical protein